MVLGAMKFSGPKPLPLVGVVLLISKTRSNTSPRLTDRGGFRPGIGITWPHCLPAASEAKRSVGVRPRVVFSIHPSSVFTV